MKTHKIFVFAALLWSVAGVASAATLTVSPASASHQIGDTFTTSILLDTTGSPIDGVDVHYLHFNPAVLQVTGVQVTPGKLMPATLTNTVNNQGGTIDFSQIVAGGQHYTGAGTLFTISFRAVGAGSSSITFDATPGKTTDSNVASVGNDILSSAVSGQVTVAGSTTGTSGTSGGGGSTGGGTSGGSTSSGGTTGVTGPGLSIVFSRLLSLGSTGSDVTALQKYLGVTATGYYGPLTQAAVGKFQLQYAITTTSSAGYGQVGPLTRAKLNSLIGGGASTGGTTAPSTGAFTKLLALGSTGSDVTMLQQFLAKDPSVYPQGTVTGYFGSLTQAAVGRFQLKYSITTTSSAGYGQVGPLTRAKLNSLMGH